MPITDGQISGKFKEVLIPFNELPEEAVHAEDFLISLRNLQSNDVVSEAETAVLFILYYHYHRTGNLKYQRRGVARPSKSPVESVLFSDLPDEFDFIKKIALDYQFTSLYEFIVCIKPRRLPDFVITSLINWMNNNWKLKLDAEVITPPDMLYAQSEGFRYVTLHWKSALKGIPIEGKRDAFEFLLHDLGHAYTFFRPDYQYNEQVEFFKCLKKDLRVIESLLADDSAFAKEFDYCLCDMNSHPEHLREYLRGIITSYFLRRNQKTEQEHLNESEREELNLFIENITALKTKVSSIV